MAARRVLGPFSAWFLYAAASMFRASSSGCLASSLSLVWARGVPGGVPLSGTSLVWGTLAGILRDGCTLHPAKKKIPGREMISWRLPSLSTILPVRDLYSPDGRQMYVGSGVASAAYPKRMVSLKPEGRVCSGVHGCLDVTAAYTSSRRSLALHSYLEHLTSTKRYRCLLSWPVSLSLYWLAIANGGKCQSGAALTDHRAIWAWFSRSGSGLKVGHCQVVWPLLTPFIAYAIAARTCAIPMRPNISNGDISTVVDLDRVSPTVILPKQSSVSSVMVPSRLKPPFRKPMLGWATTATCTVPSAELAIVSTLNDRGLFFLRAALFKLFLWSVAVVITNNPSA